MDRNIRSLAKVGFGFVSFIVSLIVFISGNFGSTAVAATIDPGSVGAFSFEALAKVAEVIFSIVTALISSGMFGKSKWLNMLVDILGPFFNQEEPPTPEQAFQNDAINLLKHAIDTKNTQLTVLLCEELAGEPFISCCDDPEHDHNGKEFPTPPVPETE